MFNVRSMVSGLKGIMSAGAGRLSAALLAGCLMAAAPASVSAGPSDHDRHDHRDGDRGGYGGRGDHDRGRGRHDHDHDRGHGRHDRHDRHVVKYHVDGRQSVYLGDKHEARDLVRWLRTLGAESHYHSGGGRYRVHFSMDGSRRQSFDSHDSARRFARRLSRLGFHIEVVS